MTGESVSELFVATLHCIRDSAAQAIKKTSDFLGKLWSMTSHLLPLPIDELNLDWNLLVVLMYRLH